ncbi:MAG: hypothetical protein EKK55_16220 [Rhodocyclaceae bacterium]|nr:MAG: hypothetical protein EKK55_16220 [Rhodocyclaceae bacterium]
MPEILARLDAAITLAATLENGVAVDFDLATLRDRIVAALREIARATEAAAPLLALLDGPRDEVEARLAAWAEARQAAALKWLADFTEQRGDEG